MVLCKRKNCICPENTAIFVGVGGLILWRARPIFIATTIYGRKNE